MRMMMRIMTPLWQHSPLPLRMMLIVLCGFLVSLSVSWDNETKIGPMIIIFLFQTWKWQCYIWTQISENLTLICYNGPFYLNSLHTGNFFGTRYIYVTAAGSHLQLSHTSDLMNAPLYFSKNLKHLHIRWWGRQYFPGSLYKICFDMLESFRTFTIKICFTNNIFHGRNLVFVMRFWWICQPKLRGWGKFFGYWCILQFNVQGFIPMKGKYTSELERLDEKVHKIHWIVAKWGCQESKQV